jgi:hypothetical protein
MADFLCADWDEDDFDTDCAAVTRRVMRSRRFGITQLIRLLIG